MPVGVMDPGVVHPVDSRALCEAVSGYRAVVTVEEHVLSGGFGAAVAAALQDGGLHDVRVVRCAVPDRFVPHGSRERLLADLGLDAASLRHTVQSVWTDLVSESRR